MKLTDSRFVKLRDVGHFSPQTLLQIILFDEKAKPL
jgi:hypothetical protein